MNCFDVVSCFDRGRLGSCPKLSLMTESHWIEHIRCPRCGKTGDAELSEIATFENRFDRVPVGFKVVTNTYGSDFHCETCNIPVAP